MKRNYIIAAVVLLVAGTGVGGFAFLSPGTTIEELNKTVLSQKEVGEGFETTHETFSNSSDYNSSLIELRVDRRFSDGNGTVILSSATVYSSKEAAESVSTSFIGRTADNVTTADFGDGEIVKLYQKTLFKDVIYFYQQKGDTIYFVSVASNSGYKEEKSKELMKEMQPESALSRLFS